MILKVKLTAWKRLAVSLCLALLASGCTMVRDPGIPATVASIRETSSFPDYKEVAPESPVQPMWWWTEMGGDELDRLVNQLLSESLELKEARERVLQAEERARQTRSRRLPQAGVNAGASTARATDPLGNDAWNESYSAALSLSFDTDIFGGLRAADRAAWLSAEASYLSYISQEQQRVAFLARSWLAAATLKRSLVLAVETVENYRSTYTLTDERYRAGSANTAASDVLIARQNLDATSAEIPNLETQLATQLLGIDQQTGSLPGSTAQVFEGAIKVDNGLAAPVGMPAALLTARPDVAAAELSYRAALEDVGSARASLLPGLSLSSSLSFQSNEVSDLFDFDDYIANLAGSLTQPIFQGGRLRSQVRLEESQARELATAYARVALSALSEVENALARQAGSLRELEQLKNALNSARDANELAQNRYRQGLLPLLSVLETQRALTNAQQNIILAEQRLLDARIDLYLSLGGVWFENETAETWRERLRKPLEKPKP